MVFGVFKQILLFEMSVCVCMSSFKFIDFVSFWGFYCTLLVLPRKRVVYLIYCCNFSFRWSIERVFLAHPNLYWYTKQNYYFLNSVRKQKNHFKTMKTWDFLHTFVKLNLWQRKNCIKIFDCRNLKLDKCSLIKLKQLMLCGKFIGNTRVIDILMMFQRIFIETIKTLLHKTFKK